MMPDFGLELPPHLKMAAAKDAAPAAAPAPAAASEAPAAQPPIRTAPRHDMVTVSTPLGSVTCPPGRLKLNLLHGGMPPIGGPDRK